MRSLCSNNLGPAAGMALAEALKGNTTLTSLESAALPSNPLAHASRPHSMHVAALARFTFLCRVRSLHYNNLGPEGGMALAEALKSNTTLKTLWSAALPSNLPAHASRSFTALRASVCVTPFLFPWKHLNTHPARALNATSHFLRVSRMSPARPHTGCTYTEHVACLPPCQQPRPRHPAWTAATPSFAHCMVGGVRACTLPLAPARRRLLGNDFDDDAKQALEAATRSGLELGC